MNVYLPDVNVLIALTWPTHVHHATARQWFERKASSGWATCPITQLGFARVSSNPKIIRDAVTPREATAMLTDGYLLSLAQHRDGKLATLDSGIASLLTDREQRARWVETLS